MRFSRARLGFTLLEVMVSLGILSVALLAIADLNGGAMRMHVYSRDLTQAVQLARGKMLDLQAEMRKDGLSDFSKEYAGDFSEEKAPKFKWRALVVKPEIELDPNQLGGMLSSGLGMLGGETTGAPEPETDPLSMLGPMAGMVDAQIKTMQETLKNSVREVRLTVSWKQGAKEETFEVVEHVVILPDAAATSTANAEPLQQQLQGIDGVQGQSISPVQMRQQSRGMTGTAR